MPEINLDGIPASWTWRKPTCGWACERTEEAILGRSRPAPRPSFTFPLRGRTADTHDLSRQLGKGSREQASEPTGLDMDPVRAVTGAGVGGLSLPLSTQGDPHGLRGEGVCPGGSD